MIYQLDDIIQPLNYWALVSLGTVKPNELFNCTVLYPVHSAVKPKDSASFDAFLGPRLPVQLKELGSWKSFGSERKRLKGIESEDM